MLHIIYYSTYMKWSQIRFVTFARGGEIWGMFVY